MVYELLHPHGPSFWLIGALSVIVFAGTLVAIPMLVIHIPAINWIRIKAKRPALEIPLHALRGEPKAEEKCLER
jgi:hypothetical protein